MAIKETEPLVRAHIWLYARDWERLKELFQSTTGPSKAVRAMVRSVLTQIEAKAQTESRARAVLVNAIAAQEQGVPDELFEPPHGS